MNEKRTSPIATHNEELKLHIQGFIKDRLKASGNKEIVPSHGAVLACVYKNDGKVQIKVIYETLKKQKSTITEMINRLVSLGYLTRETSLEDKRITYVVATEKALAFKKEFSGISEALLETMYNGFTDKEAIEFERLMIKAIKNFE